MSEEEKSSPEFWQQTRWSLAELAKQDFAAFEEQCEIYRPTVKRYLVERMGKNETDANDITQEFFASEVIKKDLFQKAEQTKGKLRTLLITALKRKCRDIIEKQAAPKRGGGADHAEIGEVDEKRGLASKDPGPDDDWDRLFGLTLMEEAFKKLQEAERQKGDSARKKFELLHPAIRAHDDKVNYTKVAEVLGITEGTARGEVSRLKLRYRIALIQECIPTMPELKGVEDPEVARKEVFVELMYLLGLFEQGR